MSKYKLIEQLGLNYAYMVGDIMHGPYVKADDLEAVLATGVRVRGTIGSVSSSWTSQLDPRRLDFPDDTHQALLINIKPIAKACEHEPVFIYPANAKPEVVANAILNEMKCKHCGMALKPKGWELV